MEPIFISYRRNDSAGHAGRLFDRLKECFGQGRIFMDIDTVRLFPRTRLSMGAPMWDYWAVLVPLMQRRRCLKMNNTCAFHLRHDQAWDNAINIRMMKEIVDHSGMQFGALAGVDVDSADVDRVSVLRQFSEIVVPYIESHSRPVF